MTPWLHAILFCTCVRQTSRLKGLTWADRCVFSQLLFGYRWLYVRFDCSRSFIPLIAGFYVLIICLLCAYYVLISFSHGYSATLAAKLIIKLELSWVDLSWGLSEFVFSELQKNRNFQPQIVSVLEEMLRWQWHQSTENPPFFHNEQTFAGLLTYDTPGSYVWKR